MKILVTALGIAALTIANAGRAGCTYPKAPEKVPDGATAPKPDMTAAMALFANYDKDVTVYVDCLNTESQDQITKIDSTLEQAKQDALKVQIQKIVEQKTEAVLAEENVAKDRINAQIRAFNNKSKKG